jgi:hypothetical protein
MITDHVKTIWAEAGEETQKRAYAFLCRELPGELRRLPEAEREALFGEGLVELRIEKSEEAKEKRAVVVGEALEIEV